MARLEMLQHVVRGLLPFVRAGEAVAGDAATASFAGAATVLRVQVRVRV